PDRRRRYQSGGAGCGCSRQYSRRALTARSSNDRDTQTGPAAPRISNARDPASADYHAEQSDRASAREQRRAAESTTVHENAAMAAVAAHSRASARLWRPPGAHPCAGSVMSTHGSPPLLRASAPVTHLIAAQRQEND